MAGGQFPFAAVEEGAGIELCEPGPCGLQVERCVVAPACAAQVTSVGRFQHGSFERQGQVAGMLKAGPEGRVGPLGVAVGCLQGASGAGGSRQR